MSSSFQGSMQRREPEVPPPQGPYLQGPSWSGGMASMGRPSLPGPSTLQGGCPLAVPQRGVHWLSLCGCRGRIAPANGRLWHTLRLCGDHEHAQRHVPASGAHTAALQTCHSPGTVVCG